MSGLGPLRELDLDHLDARGLRPHLEAFRVELPLLGAASEVTRADLPNEVTALKMVGADAALAGVVVELAQLRSEVEGADRVGAERTEAHRRDVEDARGVGLLAVRTSNGHADVFGVQVPCRDRVVHPLVADLVHVALGSEGHGVLLVLGPLVNNRALLPIEGNPAGVRLHEVLMDFRADLLEEEPEVSENRKIPEDGMSGLEDIVNSQ